MTGPQFNQQVATLRDFDRPGAAKRHQPHRAFEFLFNRLQPFSQSMTLYVLAFLLACGSWLAWQRTAESGRVLSAPARARDSHLRNALAHVSAGTAAGDESLFLRDFHRLGRRDCGADPRADLPRWHRRRLRGRDRFHHAHHRASPRRQRRHAGNAAGRARHQHLARHARGRDHHRLLRDVPRRHARDHLHRARGLHPLARLARRPTRSRA